MKDWLNIWKKNFFIILNLKKLVLSFLWCTNSFRFSFWFKGKHELGKWRVITRKKKIYWQKRASCLAAQGPSLAGLPGHENRWKLPRHQPIIWSLLFALGNVCDSIVKVYLLFLVSNIDYVDYFVFWWRVLEMLYVKYVKMF